MKSLQRHFNIYSKQHVTNSGPKRRHATFQPHIIDPATEVVVWVMRDVKLHDFENVDLIYSDGIIQHQNGNSISLAQQEGN